MSPADLRIKAALDAARRSIEQARSHLRGVAKLAGRSELAREVTEYALPMLDAAVTSREQPGSIASLLDTYETEGGQG